MNFGSWKTELPQEFSPESRVWIYQAGRRLSESESIKLKGDLSLFCKEWMSHGHAVRGWTGLFFDQFIVFISDDTEDKLCGSAVDNSIRFVKRIEKQLDISLLDRMMMAFDVNDQVVLYPVNKIGMALENGFIHEETLYFNNTVTTKSSLESNWIIPLKDSWIGKKYLQGAEK